MRLIHIDLQNAFQMLKDGSTKKIEGISCDEGEVQMYMTGMIIRIDIKPKKEMK